MHWDFWIVVKNPVFIIGILSWVIAQILKMFSNWWQTKEFDIKAIFHSGGMPSSHSSATIAVATSIGILYGFDTSLFVASLAFSGIVMYDAAGVRLQAGKQAQIINDLVELFKHIDEFKAVNLKEIIGHEPIEVLSGAILGIAIAVLYCLIFLT